MGGQQFLQLRSDRWVLAPLTEGRPDRQREGDRASRDFDVDGGTNITRRRPDHDGYRPAFVDPGSGRDAEVLEIVARDCDTHQFGLAGLQVDLGEAAEFLWRCRHGFRVVTDVELDDFSTCYGPGVGHRDVGGEGQRVVDIEG